MKILIISAGRINGNTQRAAHALCAGLAALAKTGGMEVETDMISLNATELKPCRGCRACFEKGEERCPLGDAAISIAEKTRGAGAVILASPVYVEDVSGTMKTFIDRMAYNCYRPAFAGKLAFAVTTSGVGSTTHAAKTMAGALQLWGFKVSGTMRLRMGEKMSEDELTERCGKTLKAAVKKVYSGLKTGAALRPTVRSLIVFAVQQISWQKAREQSLTREYWQKKGWLEAGCTYYIPHRRNRALTAAARIIGRVVALFFV